LEKSILILSMGGTIGMRPVEGGTLAPDSVLERLHHWVPELEILADVQVEVLADLDSSCMVPAQWLHLARRIETAQTAEDWDGVVVLHGTDTMAYTASALSFLLPALQVPVVLTGGQRPLAETRTDARNNLIGAVESCLEGPVEVMVFFNNYAWRGNRATKATISEFEGFASPNFPPLGYAGIAWTWNQKDFWPPDKRPSIWPPLPESLPTAPLVLPWVPGLDAATLIPAIEAQWAIVLEAFGTGNMPMPDLLGDALEAFMVKGGLVFLKSQVVRGRVQPLAYSPGKAIEDMGIIACGDLTREALVTKLMVLKSMSLSKRQLERHMKKNMVGELTV